MKALYLILALAALSYQAGAVEYTSPTPMDSIIKPLKIKKLDKNMVIEGESPNMLKKPTKPVKESADKPTRPKRAKTMAEVMNTNAGDNGNTGTKKFGFGIPDNGNMAHFPGGERGIREFVKKNKRYPAECKANRVSGIVTISMTIAPDGTPGYADITKSSGNELLDAEALRIAGLMPKWTPAKNIETGVERIYQMRITFRPGR